MKLMKIVKIEHLESHLLRVYCNGPIDKSFQYIYRAGNGVSWNEELKCFESELAPGKSVESFRRVLAAALGELGIVLKLGPRTVFSSFSSQEKTELLSIGAVS